MNDKDNIIKEDSFYQVSGWMTTKMSLKGVQLVVFALIYGFSHDGKSRFSGSKDYLGAWANAGESAIKTALRILYERKLINKYPVSHRRGIVYEYAVDLAMVEAEKRKPKAQRLAEEKARKEAAKKKKQGGQKVTGSESDGVRKKPQGGQKVPSRGSESDPIYNSNNNIENKIEEPALEKNEIEKQKMFKDELGYKCAAMFIELCYNSRDHLTKSKANLFYKFLRYRQSIKRSVNDRTQFLELMKDFKSHSDGQLKESIKKSMKGGYPALYFDNLPNTSANHRGDNAMTPEEKRDHERRLEIGRQRIAKMMKK